MYYGESGLSWSEEASNDLTNASSPRRRALDVSSRPGFATALISDCSDHVSRLDYIRELGKHVPVDLYGKCSGVKCPREGYSGSNDHCREWLARNYKFFLAFENSVCDGYVTEKLFATLRYDVVPVVLGGADYSR